MKLIARILVPLGILGFAFAVVSWLMATRPTPQRRTPPPSVVAVDATKLKRTSYQVKIPTYGKVKPRTQSSLRPEVAGRVVTISPNFREGGFFEEGEVLLQIDPRDYEARVASSEARLLRAEAGSKLAKLDHDRNLRVFEENLISEAEVDLSAANLAQLDADVASAQTELDQAKRDLTRTTVKAPYAGRVQSYSVDVGQYVSPGNELAAIFAVDYVEIRMPVGNKDIDFVRLPEDYRGESATDSAIGPRVVLKGDYGSREVSWEGRIVRADGAYDAGTTQLFVVAQVDDPYSQKGRDTPPLKVGQYVEAEIEGELLQAVFVIPSSAVRDGREVLIIDGEGTIRRRPIGILFRDADNIVVRDGLKEGEILCTTTMTFAADGAKVQATIDGVPPKRKGPAAGGQTGKPGMAKPASERKQP